MGSKQEREFHFRSELHRSDNKLWGCHFNVPRTIAQKLLDGDSRRVFCTLNGTITYQCAILPHGNRTFVITLNKSRQTRLRLKSGDSIDVTLKKDSSKYGLPVPEELEALFMQDTQGSKLFHALTRGKQRTLLYIIGNVKDTEKRIARAVTVVNHLKRNNGSINYKRLAASLKDLSRLRR